MDDKYIRERITQLRIAKGVSEYKMSTDLGHSKSYIQSISSGRTLPSMGEFIAICDYLEVEPHDFFSETAPSSILVKKACADMETLSENDLLIILTLIERLKRQ